MVKYKRLSAAISRDREQVSLQWYVLLQGIHDQGVQFNANEGHRTIARQWELYRAYLSGRGNLAAVPSPFAPHIRTGRPDHAVDFDNAAGVQAAARKLGVALTLTVPGESWHLEANAGHLASYYEHNKARVLGIGHRNLRPGMRGADVRHFQQLAKKKGILAKDHKVGSLYGIRAARKVKAWKKTHHLPHDSVIGADMWRRLEA